MAAGLLPLAAPLSLLFSTGFLSPSAQFALLSCCLFIGKNGATNSSSSSTKVAANSSSSSTVVAANLWHLGWVHMVGATPAPGSWQWQPSPRVGLLPHKWQYHNNHPLCHLCGATVILLLQHKLASCSSSKLTILKASSVKFTGTCHIFQSPESPKHTFSHTKGSLQPDGLPLHIWKVLTLVSGTHNIPLRAYQPCSIRNDLSSFTSRLTTPPQTKISISKCDNHYLSISIWSRAHHSSKSLLIPELRLPSVLP